MSHCDVIIHSKELKYIKFGDLFIHWSTTIIYNNNVKTIIKIWHSPEHFLVTWEIKQGCPLSQNLSIISRKVLGISTWAKKNLTGLWVGIAELKLSQITDDTTLTCIRIVFLFKPLWHHKTLLTFIWLRHKCS